MDENLTNISYDDTPANYSNSSSLEPGDLPPEWSLCHLLVTVTVISMSILIVEIILGNLLVIVAILTQQYLRTPSNMTVLSMATADLAVGIFILPLNIADMVLGWQFGWLLCRIWLTADVALCSTSILHISAIAVDRFRSINEGVMYAQSRNLRMSLFVCGVLWLISLWIASSQALGWNDWKDQDQYTETITCSLFRDLGYFIHLSSGTFVIPALIVVTLYFRIFLLIRKKSRKCASLGQDAGATNHTAPSQEGELSDSGEEHLSSGDIVEEESNRYQDRETRVRLTEPEPPVRSTTMERERTNNPMNRKKYSKQIEDIVKARLRFSLTRERRAAKTLGIIIGAFLLCWIPFTLVLLSDGILFKVYKKQMVPFWLFQTVTWLGYVNSGLNPIIYTVYNPDFKRAFKTVWAHFRCKSWNG